MKDFIEKWNSEPKFKTKVKLGLYTLFMIVVSIFALSTGRNVPVENTSLLDDKINNKENIVKINVPEKYNYTINITINENNYQYTGKKQRNAEQITKIINDTSTDYLYQGNNYYEKIDEEYMITTKDEVYNIIDYNYLNLDIINQYLSKSKIENKKNIVYLKDIILGNTSEEYITISIDDNIVNVDYTALMNNFNKSVEKNIVEIIIEDIE